MQALFEKLAELLDEWGWLWGLGEQKGFWVAHLADSGSKHWCGFQGRPSAA